jgi:hypothetical protein
VPAGHKRPQLRVAIDPGVRPPDLMTAPASMKQGPSIVTSGSMRASGDTTAWPASPSNGGAAKRPLMMS